MAISDQVYIVDDDEAVRESLSFLCLTAGLKAETFSGPRAFLAAAGTLKAGCIVTDVRMPEMDGLTLVRALHDRGVGLPMVVMTGHGDVPMAVAAMKAGAIDFLEKPFDDEVFLTTVRDALDREAAGAAPRPAGSSDLDAKLALLSERERQVLERLVEGDANKMIAYHLGISPRTVEIYRAKVMAKMEAATFADLMRMVIAGRAEAAKR
jgi:two-component system response regulator FixJ